MAKAHSSPGRRERKFIITDHAEERFRERLLESSLEYRTTGNVKDLLDEALCAMFNAGSIEERWQLGAMGPEHIWVVEVGGHVGSDSGMYAVVLDAGDKKVAKTVLDKQMKANNDANAWSRSLEGLGKTGLRVPLPIPKDVVVAEEKKDLSPFLVTVRVDQDAVETHFVMGLVDTKKLIGTLYNRHGAGAKIMVWEPSSLKFRARVVTEFDDV